MLYCLGSKKIKEDALSGSFEPCSTTKCDEQPILPSAQTISSLFPNLFSLFQVAQKSASNSAPIVCVQGASTVM